MPIGTAETVILTITLGRIRNNSLVLKERKYSQAGMKKSMRNKIFLGVRGGGAMIR